MAPGPRKVALDPRKAALGPRKVVLDPRKVALGQREAVLDLNQRKVVVTQSLEVIQSQVPRSSWEMIMTLTLVS